MMANEKRVMVTWCLPHDLMAVKLVTAMLLGLGLPNSHGKWLLLLWLHVAAHWMIVTYLLAILDATKRVWWQRDAFSEIWLEIKPRQTQPRHDLLRLHLPTNQMIATHLPCLHNTRKKLLHITTDFYKVLVVWRLWWREVSDTYQCIRFGRGSMQAWPRLVQYIKSKYTNRQQSI